MIPLLRYLPILAVVFVIPVFLSMEPGTIRSMTAHWPTTALSIVLLYLVFWFRALTWWRFLASKGIPVGFRTAVVSRFITILTKYVPGKVWPLLSMAAYIESEAYAYRDSLASVSMYQAAILASGIGLGGVGILAILHAPIGLYPMPLVVIFLAATAVDRRWFAERVIRPLSCRFGLSARHAGLRSSPLLLACTGHWVIMAVAYWLMFRSVTLEVSLPVVLAQSLANVVGMLVPFTPGGLGVREAAATGYLATVTLDAGTALVYASLARAWSFLVEVLVFSTGLLLNRLA